MSLMCGAVVSTPHTVAFVDGGGGSFNGSQLEHLLAARGLKKNALTVALEKVRVFKVFSAFDLLSFFVSLHRNISQQVRSHIVADSSYVLTGIQFYGRQTVSMPTFV